MGGQVTVALGIGLYFLCLFKAPCHWFISPNRGGTFLREISNGIKVRHEDTNINIIFGSQSVFMSTCEDKKVWSQDF